MMRISRHSIAAIGLILVIAACGGDDDAAETTTTAAGGATTAQETTTTAASETTTTAAAETTTTAAAESTTTAAATADGLVVAKVEAATAAIPEGWTSSAIESDLGAAESDEVFSECSGDAAFDLAELDDVTKSIATVTIDAAPDPTSFFPPPSATVEARVFDSPAIASEAFVVLETVLGSDDGRECLAERFQELIAEGTPEDAEFDLSLEELSIPGADVGTRLTLSATAQGITFAFQFDLVAALDGDCTVYATFISFGEPTFDPAVRDAIFSAATGV